MGGLTCLIVALAASFVAGAGIAAEAVGNRYQEARMDMLEAIRESTAETVSYTGRRKLSDRVMAA